MCRWSLPEHPERCVYTASLQSRGLRHVVRKRGVLIRTRWSSLGAAEKMTVWGTRRNGARGCWPLHEKKELKQDTEECCYTLSAAGVVPPHDRLSKHQNGCSDGNEWQVQGVMDVKQQQPIYEVINMFTPSPLCIFGWQAKARLKPDSSPHLSSNCISFIPHTRWIVSAFLPDVREEKTVHLCYITARGDRRQRMERFKGPGSLFIFYKSALYSGVASERR